MPRPERRIWLRAKVAIEFGSPKTFRSQPISQTTSMDAYLDSNSDYEIFDPLVTLPVDIPEVAPRIHDLSRGR
jgi:hypothetical protein